MIKLTQIPALGKQLKHIYRYGTPTVCAEKMEAFRFCLSLKALSPEDRYEAWIQRRAQVMASKRLTQSSEDVWEAREASIAPSDPHPEPERKKGWFS